MGAGSPSADDLRRLAAASGFTLAARAAHARRTALRRAPSAARRRGRRAGRSARAAEGL